MAEKQAKAHHIDAAVRAAVDAACAPPAWADADPEAGSAATDGRVFALALALSSLEARCASLSSVTIIDSVTRFSPSE
mgnify:CR=1 FL=1